MVVYWAAQALGRIGDPRAVPALARALKTAGEYSYKVAEVLERFHTEEARAAVDACRRADADPLEYRRWIARVTKQATAVK